MLGLHLDGRGIHVAKKRDCLILICMCMEWKIPELNRANTMMSGACKRHMQEF